MTINKISLAIFALIVLYSCNSEENIPQQSEENKSQQEEISVNQNSWVSVPTIDEFGIETGDYTIAAEFKGTMSNSATSNAELSVIAQMSDGQIYMTFREYGYMPANLPHSQFIYVSVRRPNGEVEHVGQFFFRGYMVDSGYLPGSDPNYSLPEWRDKPTFGDGSRRDNQLLDILLEESEPIIVRVEMSRVDRSNSAVYVFSMDNYGLIEMMDNGI